MNEGLLSVVMVCFNHADHLKRSIGSVLSQAYPNWELIVVDDGSQDGSLALINDYSFRYPEKIKLYTHPGNRNLGIAASYALGLEQCRGEYVGFLEPDDQWEENNSLAKIEALRVYPVSLVYSYVRPVGEPESIEDKRLILKLVRSAPRNKPFNGFPRILFYNFIPGFSAVLIKKTAANGIKFLSQGEYPVWSDWFFWFQISRKGSFILLPQELVKWRLHKESYCSKFEAGGLNADRIISRIKFRMRLLKELFSAARGR